MIANTPLAWLGKDGEITRQQCESDDVPLYAAPEQPVREVLTEDLHTFLDAAAGEGYVLDGIDAADLYIALFPERYAANGITKD